jgi:hypothetical protein
MTRLTSNLDLDRPLESHQKQSVRFAVGSIELPGIDKPDFQALFRYRPGMFVVTRPDFTIAAASDDLLRKTMTWREDVTDRHLFDVFPNHPSSLSNTREAEASMRDVLVHGVPHRVQLLRYDIRDRMSGGGAWIEKFWTVVNRPVVLRDTGEVLYVLTEARDVTRTVQLALWLVSRAGLGDEMQQHVRRIQREALTQNPHVVELTAAIDRERALTGATWQTLVNELKALLRAPESRLYACAGEWAPESGVYVPYHREGCTLPPHAGYFVEGDPLPACERCGNDVLYRLSYLLGE